MLRREDPEPGLPLFGLLLFYCLPLVQDRTVLASRLAVDLPNVSLHQMRAQTRQWLEPALVAGEHRMSCSCFASWRCWESRCARASRREGSASSHRCQFIPARNRARSSRPARASARRLSGRPCRMPGPHRMAAHSSDMRSAWRRSRGERYPDSLKCVLATPTRRADRTYEFGRKVTYVIVCNRSASGRQSPGSIKKPGFPRRHSSAAA
jgi:hypothetical protein